MKKLIWVIFISLCLSSSAYSKIDKSYVNQIYEGCISDAKQNNDYNSDSKKFCKCYANEFNKKFNNAGLMKFMNKSDQAKAKIIQNEISPPCYPVSKKKKKSNLLSSVFSKLPVLECSYKYKGENIIEKLDLNQIDKKMKKQGYGGLKVSKDLYEAKFLSKDGSTYDDGIRFDETLVTGKINRSTGDLKMTLSKTWNYFFDVDNVSKEERFSDTEHVMYGTCKKIENKNL